MNVIILFIHFAMLLDQYWLFCVTFTVCYMGFLDGTNVFCWGWNDYLINSFTKKII